MRCGVSLCLLEQPAQRARTVRRRRTAAVEARDQALAHELPQEAASSSSAAASGLPQVYPPLEETFVRGLYTCRERGN